MRRRSLTLAILLFGSASALAAQVPVTIKGATPIVQTAKIRGLVFDSLLMRPIEGATVTLLGRVGTVVSDQRGRFTFENLPAGEHTVMFTSPDLDSLGLGAMGTTLTLAEAATVNLTLATPSLRTLWQRRCLPGTQLSADSGIVWGTIRNASTNQPLEGAAATFSWYDLRPRLAPGLLIDDIRREVITDNTGLFFACGIPTEIVISSTALDTSSARGQAASGTIEYAVGSRRLQRLDLLVSADMVLPDSISALAAADTTMSLRARGTATVKGIVIDDRKRPIADAVVTVSSADTSARTDKDGAFLIGGLPGGTHSMQTKRIGFTAVSQTISLRADSVTVVSVVAANYNTSAVFNVRAQRTKGADRTDYELRRKMGFGYFMEGKQLENRADLQSVLSQFPGLMVRSNGMDLEVTTMAMMRGRCTPAVFLDGLPTNYARVNMLRPGDYRAVEVYLRASSIPLQYSTFSGCGSILFWSRNAAW